MKRKLDSNENDGESKLVRANEIIDLVFVENDLQNSFLTNPTFTHQIFENETIHNLTNPSECRIKVFINCSDMNVNLQLNGFISNEEQNVIVGQMKVAIPKNFTTNKKDFICFNNSNNTNPPGICIKKFILNEESYEIWLTRHTDEGSTALVERVGKIAVWFIETADSIDFTDDRWEALFLYHVKSSKVSSSISKPLYYLGGYITLFTFRNPFAGSKIRVCQALVFPHLQRKGVGKEMLKSVYDIALERNEIVEVTVEDPASGFQRLRDKVEFSLAKSTFQKLEITDSKLLSTKLTKILKLTPSQAIYIAEGLLLNEILVSCGNERFKYDLENLNRLEAFKKFRLNVKRRILSENPDFKSFTIEKKQKMLEELFEYHMKRHIAMIT